MENGQRAILSAVAKVSKDSKNLVDIFETDPKTARIILDEYYDGMGIEDFKTSIGYKEDLSDPKVAERRIYMEAQKRLDRMLVDKEKQAFIERLKMTTEEKTLFEEALAERMELKTFKAEDIDKHLEKAYREISDNTEILKTIKSQETIARSMAT